MGLKEAEKLSASCLERLSNILTLRNTLGSKANYGRTSRPNLIVLVTNTLSFVALANFAPFKVVFPNSWCPQAGHECSNLTSLCWEVDWHVDDVTGEDQIHVLDLWICLLDCVKTKTVFLSDFVERIAFFDVYRNAFSSLLAGTLTT
jgi:hypothetical protein